MRIHRLEVAAFGPFAGKETVDFDRLTDSGLFLLCGPTGAGKTSVLDAVCFGLYGEVPGDRNTARRLRSDHAAPGEPPSVLLEVTVEGRRFRIRRSPAWTRPKRRGTGTTTEQARVTLEEYVGGAWTHLSNRLDETGQLVTDLLGMNVSQFTQVAMLPQGRFQAFLRARSDERHKVLQRLFRTSRFEEVERWLVARRQTLRTRHRDHQERVASVVSRLSEAAGVELPDAWDLHDLAEPADHGELDRWSEALCAEAQARRVEAADELELSARQERRARAAFDAGRTSTDLRARHDRALRTEQALADTRSDEAAVADALDAARRAAAVLPLARVAEDAAAAATRAQERLVGVLADAAAELGAEQATLTADDLVAAEQEARETAAIARSLLPRETEMQTALQEAEAAAEALESVRGTATVLDERCRAIPGELAALRRDLEEAVSLASRREEVEARQAQLSEQLAAAERLVHLRADTERARERLLDATATAQTRREQMQDVREARINGMAAELAAALVGGDACPVCGSADHPSVARPADGAPTRADEETARSAYEDADFVRQAAAEALAALERNVAVAEQAAGRRTHTELAEEIAHLRTQRDACQDAGSRQRRLGEQVRELEAELDAARRQAQEARSQEATLVARIDHSRKVVERVSAELAALFADQDVDDSVARLLERKSRAGALFAAARDALAAQESAAARAREAAEQASGCAREHLFESVDEARTAAADDDRVAALESRLKAREEQRAEVRAVLADPEVARAVGAEAPDLVELEAAVRAADDARTGCAAAARVAATREERLRALRFELAGELAAWAPTRDAYAVAHRISTFAEGKGGDNALQMRLSAYVLASRLQQVVDAANERLGRMTDERYTLEHSTDRGAGDQRGGLGLLVRDQWTGESRDPATLSGGETFVASLALALGLADVVTQEAGGTSIETLFIDEGFGSLDPETLDDVMDTLDGLRDGGRVVGVVSHVPEMRTRVPAQLRIRKERSGSRVVAAREQV